METITIIDTSFSTDNLGDEIVMDAVNEAVYELFPDAYIFRVPSHEPLSRRSYDFIRRSDLCFIGGTNILGSPGWRLRWYEGMILRRAVCIGVSWAVACRVPQFRDRLLLRSSLAKNTVHSVRDSYTGRLLKQLDIQSTTTSCPTMWKLSTEHCTEIPPTKAPDVVFTLTAYRSDPEADRAMIAILRRNYRRLHFFPQMHEDCSYIRQFNDSGVRVISPRLNSYDHFLANENVDYVGSRLHGGIRALQHKKRAVVIGVDHRSIEIGADTGLPVIDRKELCRLEQWVNGCGRTEIRLPEEQITGWKAQFAGRCPESLTGR